MEQVVVLHLSDIHFGWDGDESRRTDRGLALDGLLRLLTGLDGDWKPNCVCISGDIGWRGLPKDYLDAAGWIEQLLAALKLPAESLFTCPGNHDVNRIKAMQIIRPTSSVDADRVLGVPIQKPYKEPFKAYERFCMDVGMPPYSLGKRENLLVGCRTFRHVTFVAYNSAWFSQDNEDKGKLWLGLPQIRHMENERHLPNPSEIAECFPIIAFFHHPYEWFHEAELHASNGRPNTFDYMARRCHLFLTGHSHAEVRDADKIGGGGWHLSGGATFAGASHFNYFRILQVKTDHFVYRTFEYDPRSPDNNWQEKGGAKSLEFNPGMRRCGPESSSSVPNAKGAKPGVPGITRVSRQNRPIPTHLLHVTPGFKRSRGGKAESIAGIETLVGTRTEEFNWDVFISYSSSDSDVAVRIRTKLGERGLRVWIDKEQILPGDLAVSKMEKGLERSSAVAILVSPASLDSRWVKEEYSRAISLTTRVDSPVRVIPVLIKEAPLPGFLANRNWVDFRDESLFDNGIEALVRGIRAEAGHRPISSVNPLLVEMSFLWFFPEGVLAGLYRHVVAEMGLEESSAKAEHQGLVRAVDSEGPALVGANAEHIDELGGLVENRPRLAARLLSSAKRWVEESSVFADIVSLGIGRVLLIRDLARLAQYLSDDGDSSGELKEWTCQLARLYLPVVAEQHVRIAVEISEGILATRCMRRPADDLTLAHLLLAIGRARQAADVFEIYRGPDLFDELDLDEFDRFNFALDWAKATKDVGRAREMHHELVAAYDQMLQLLSKIQPVGDQEGRAIDSARADVFNNRGTQIAQFGEDVEWTKALMSFSQAREIYERLGDTDRLLATQANLVAQALDRFDRKKERPPKKSLNSLLKSLDRLDPDADRSGANENVFFFLYQRARLVKRLHTSEPALAATYYGRAAEVAERAGLPHRAAIARSWGLRLRKQADNISESDYLEGLRHCATSLRAYPDDAWASHSLASILLDMAGILRARKAPAEASELMVEAFELEARHASWSEHSTLPFRLRGILLAMNGLDLDEGSRTQFLRRNMPLLRRLLGTRDFEGIEWADVAGWLTQ